MIGLDVMLIKILWMFGLLLCYDRVSVEIEF